MKAWLAEPGKPLTQPELAAWLLRDFPAGRRLLPLLRSAVRRGSELLTEEGLLEERPSAGYVVGPDGATGSAPAGLVPTLRGERLLAGRELDRWGAQYVHRHLQQMTSPQGLARCRVPGLAAACHQTSLTCPGHRGIPTR